MARHCDPTPLVMPSACGRGRDTRVCELVAGGNNERTHTHAQILDATCTVHCIAKSFAQGENATLRVAKIEYSALG